MYDHSYNADHRPYKLSSSKCDNFGRYRQRRENMPPFHTANYLLAGIFSNWRKYIKIEVKLN